MNAADLALALLALPAAAACGYLLLLAVCSGRPRSPAGASPRLFFDVIVPAHDEAGHIAATVAGLKGLDYPPHLFRVLVVADNCTDSTAAQAAAAGAEVLVRDQPELRGKGYALELAFARSLAEGRADALVVVDADAIASTNLLRVFSAYLEAGAEAVQSDNAVLNATATWRTRIMHIALTTFVAVRSMARERLGWSAGLRGTGMCFARATLLRVKAPPHSNVEDLEYSLRLGEAGVRVRFAHEAHVRSEMTTSSAAAAVQRSRWEGGRRRLARAKGFPLLRKAIAARSGLLLDLALDLLVPPLAQLAALVATGTLLSAALALHRHEAFVSLFAWGGCAAALLAYCIRGWALSGSGARGLLDLAGAPFYIAWKIVALLRGAGSADAWVRTAREKSARGG